MSITPAIRGRGPWELAFERLRRDRAAIASAITILFAIVVALAAPLLAQLTGHSPIEQFSETGLSPTGIPVGPGREFWLGADALGRDVLVRIAYGTRISLLVGVLASGLAVLIGAIVGNVTFKDTALRDLPELLMQADIGVASYKFDGFTDGCLPTKLLEYTALGIPSVVALTPVITDYFDETLVEFCAPEDAKDLADHIYLLYSNPERYNELARNTAKFNARYNWTAQASEYLRLIESLSQK